MAPGRDFTPEHGQGMTQGDGQEFDSAFICAYIRIPESGAVFSSSTGAVPGPGA